MTLMKSSRGYIVKDKGSLHKVDFSSAFEYLNKAGIHEDEILLAFQTLKLCNHNVAEFGDVYKTLIYTKNAE